MSISYNKTVHSNSEIQYWTSDVFERTDPIKPGNILHQQDKQTVKLILSDPKIKP